MAEYKILLFNGRAFIPDRIKAPFLENLKKSVIQQLQLQTLESDLQLNGYTGEMPVAINTEDKLENYLNNNAKIFVDTVGFSIEDYKLVVKEREQRIAVQGQKRDRTEADQLHEPDLKRQKIDPFAYIDREINKMTQQIKNEIQLPNFQKSEEDRMDELKQIFGDEFIKKSIMFDPLNGKRADIRFMEQEVSDPVFEFMKKEATNPTYDIYMLRAMSGAGKTGTILNAIGRNSYLLYVQGDIVQGRVGQDFVDMAYKKLLLYLQGRSVTECTLLCKAFWLARMKLLSLVCKDLTPAQWLYWCSNGGMLSVIHLQGQLLDLISKHLDVAGLSGHLDVLIDAEMKNLGNFLWIALDEAHLIEDYKIKRTTATSADRDLLKILALDAIHSPHCKIVVASTKMTDFSLFVQNGGANSRTYFNLETQPMATYPYVKPEQSMQIMAKYFDLSKISEDNLEVAKTHLQGRLRYVMRFFGIMLNIAKDQKGKSTNPNDIFAASLKKLNQEIKEFIDYRLASMAHGHNSNLVLLHISNVLYSSACRSTRTWDAKHFHMQFGFDPDDTGFLFFQKNSSGTGYCYSITEPQVQHLLYANDHIKKFAFEKEKDVLENEFLDEITTLDESEKAYIKAHERDEDFAAETEREDNIGDD